MEMKRKEIEKLVDRAAEAKTADEAMKFSQAAYNAANAMSCLVSIEQEAKRKNGEALL